MPPEFSDTASTETTERRHGLHREREMSIDVIVLRDVLQELHIGESAAEVALDIIEAMPDGWTSDHPGKLPIEALLEVLDHVDAAPIFDREELTEQVMTAYAQAIATKAGKAGSR